MPCQTPLSGVLDGWTARQVRLSARNVRRFGTQPRRLNSNSDSDISRREFDTPEQRRKQQEQDLQRLDRAVDHHDLDNTLEAHRESNLASVIRPIYTNGPVSTDFRRPSFLKDVPNPKLARSSKSRPPRRPLHQDRENYEGSNVKLPASDMLNKMFGIAKQSSADLQKAAPNRNVPSTTKPTFQVETWETLNVDRPQGHIVEETRRAFLRKHEDPLLPFSEIRNRAAYLDSMRRVRWTLAKLARETNAYRSNPPGLIMGIPDISEDILEYVGQAVPLTASDLDPTASEPWAYRPQTEDYTPEQQLQFEIDLFMQWLAPTLGEAAGRRAVYLEMEDLLREAVPIVKTKTFGSETVDLVTPMSDLDIRIFRADESQYSGIDRAKNMKASMDTIYEALEKSPAWTNIVRHRGRFPLLGATHVASGLPVQLVAHSGTTVTASQRSQLQYLAEFPTLKPLYLLVRTIFHMRRLTDVWDGGMASYSIFMMTVASLKHQKNAHDPLVKQLVAFMDFFASFDVYKAGLSIEPPMLFVKKWRDVPQTPTQSPERWKVGHGQFILQARPYYQRYLLCLQDPSDPYNDLGKKSFAIKDIQVTLATLRDDLRGRLHEQKGALSFTSAPILRRLVGRCDQIFDQRRLKLEINGEEAFEGLVARGWMVRRSRERDDVEKRDSTTKMTEDGGEEGEEDEVEHEYILLPQQSTKGKQRDADRFGDKDSKSDLADEAAKE
ncbi:hypothetical protein AAFC00_001247 [Neodothiora populina]|uniref:Poly(A) RNA polymerase mitochondrial-like central palm domain-containing protein n=1 Tax=Neodothiora populina TaxID=2781224 RepID=A0ABR3PNB2_9PEZI